MYRKISSSWFKHWDFILLDLIVLQVIYVISIMCRNGFVNPYGQDIYRQEAIILCLADICTVFFTEEYSGIMRRGYFQEFKAALKHVVIVYLMMISYLFLMKRGEDFSRISLVIFVIFGFAGLYLERLLWKIYLLKHKKVFYAKRAILILTTRDRAERVVETVLKNTYNELEVRGVILADDDSLVGTNIAGVSVVCKVTEIPDHIQTRWVDSMLINVREGTVLPRNLELTCISMGLTVHRKLARVGENARNQQLDSFGGYVVLSTNIRMATSRQLILKRLMDICGAVVGLIFTAILGIFIAPAIYIASPGPVLFSQVRVGRNGRKFKIYKFRSMYMDAEKRKKELMEKNEMKGFMFKMDADPRIIGSGPDGTKHGLGWFIRKTSIDEFPQFWNILKGDMSLVGTRPPTVDEWEQYEPHHRGRMAMKPGLTGMWQVSGRSDITDFEEVVKLDMDYIQKWNIGMDIKILLKTVMVVFKGSGSK